MTARSVLLFITLILLPVIVAATRPSAACGSAAPYPISTLTLDSLISGGLNRTFRVYLPAAYSTSTPQPLVIMSHGGGGSSLQFSSQSAMIPVSEENNFTMVFGDGTGSIQTWNGGSCCGQAVTNNVDDVGFISSLIDFLATQICIDLDRVYAAGHSNGGILSHRLGCELSDKIAAIVPNSGTIGITNSVCDAAVKRKIPVMHIHGTGDLHVPWNGGIGCGFTAGITFSSVNYTIEGWRVRNGCAQTDTPFYQSGNCVCRAFTGCASGSEVVLCHVYDGGHDWFGNPPSGQPCVGEGTNNTAFHSSQAAWNFLKSYTLANGGSTTTSPASSTSSSSSPASNLEILLASFYSLLRQHLF